MATTSELSLLSKQQLPKSLSATFNLKALAVFTAVLF